MNWNIGLHRNIAIVAARPLTNADPFPMAATVAVGTSADS